MAFCKALDIMELRNDPKFKTNDLRLENRVELKALIEQILAKHSTKEILQRIGDTGIPHSPVNTFEQLVQDPHVLACNLIQDLSYHDGRSTKQLPSAIKMGEQRLGIKSQAPPLGQDTEETLLDIGYSRDEIGRLKELKAI